MFDKDFPNLSAINKTSDATREYNCIAWAMGDNGNWWWPIRGAWPSDVPRENTVEAFEKAFALFGYEPCANGDFEAGKEKVALFLKAGKPTHAARLLSNGKWTSKLGANIDIAHEIHELDGPAYGTVHSFYARDMNT